MNTKMKFKIILINENGEEKKIWSGSCTEKELRKRFNDRIKAQLVEYYADPKYCQLRAYNEHGIIVAQETFHAN